MWNLDPQIYDEDLEKLVEMIDETWCRLVDSLPHPFLEITTEGQICNHIQKNSHQPKKAAKLDSKHAPTAQPMRPIWAPKRSDRPANKHLNHTRTE